MTIYANERLQYLFKLLLVLDFSSYVIIGGLNLNSGLEASTIVVTSTAEEKLLISSIVSLQEEKPSSLFPLLFYIARSCNNCCQLISTMTLLPFHIKNNLFIETNISNRINVDSRQYFIFNSFPEFSLLIELCYHNFCIGVYFFHNKDCI